MHVRPCGGTAAPAAGAGSAAPLYQLPHRHAQRSVRVLERPRQAPQLSDPVGATECVEAGRVRIAEQRTEALSKGPRSYTSRAGPELHDELIGSEAVLAVEPARAGVGRWNTQPRQKNRGENGAGEESQK